jgi:hypothetical protein
MLAKVFLEESGTVVSEPVGTKLIPEPTIGHYTKAVSCVSGPYSKLSPCV